MIFQSNIHHLNLKFHHLVGILEENASQNTLVVSVISRPPKRLTTSVFSLVFSRIPTR